MIGRARIALGVLVTILGTTPITLSQEVIPPDFFARTLLYVLCPELGPCIAKSQTEQTILDMVELFQRGDFLAGQETATNLETKYGVDHRYLESILESTDLLRMSPCTGLLSDRIPGQMRADKKRLHLTDDLQKLFRMNNAISSAAFACDDVFYVDSQNESLQQQSRYLLTRLAQVSSPVGMEQTSFNSYSDSNCKSNLDHCLEIFHHPPEIVIWYDFMTGDSARRTGKNDVAATKYYHGVNYSLSGQNFRAAAQFCLRLGDLVAGLRGNPLTLGRLLPDSTNTLPGAFNAAGAPPTYEPNFEQAEYYYEQARGIIEQHGISEMKSLLSLHQANLSNLMEQKDASVKYREALQLAETHRQLRLASLLHGIIGIVENDSTELIHSFHEFDAQGDMGGQWTISELIYHEALTQLEKPQRKGEEISRCFNLIDALVKSNAPTQTAKLQEHFADLYQQIGLYDTAANLYSEAFDTQLTALRNRKISPLLNPEFSAVELDFIKNDLLSLIHYWQDLLIQVSCVHGLEIWTKASAKFKSRIETACDVIGKTTCAKILENVPKSMSDEMALGQLRYELLESSVSPAETWKRFLENNNQLNQKKLATESVARMELDIEASKFLPELDEEARQIFKEYIPLKAIQQALDLPTPVPLTPNRSPDEEDPFKNFDTSHDGTEFTIEYFTLKELRSLSYHELKRKLKESVTGEELIFPDMTLDDFRSLNLLAFQEQVCHGLVTSNGEPSYICQENEEDFGLLTLREVRQELGEPKLGSSVSLKELRRQGRDFKIRRELSQKAVFDALSLERYFRVAANLGMYEVLQRTHEAFEQLCESHSISAADPIRKASADICELYNPWRDFTENKISGLEERLIARIKATLKSTEPKINQVFSDLDLLIELSIREGKTENSLCHLENLCRLRRFNNDRLNGIDRADPKMIELAMIEREYLSGYELNVEQQIRLKELRKDKEILRHHFRSFPDLIPCMQINSIITQIPNNAMLVTYHSTSRKSYAWMATGGDGHVKVVELPETLETIDTQVDKLLISLENGLDFTSAAQNLYRLLVQPLGEIPDGCTLIFMLPRSLQRIPFEILGPDGNILLFKQHPIVYTNNIVAIEDDIPKTEDTGKTLSAILVADATVGYAKEEIEMLRNDLLSHGFYLPPPASNLGELGNGIKSAQILHVAGHGVIEDTNTYNTHMTCTTGDGHQTELPIWWIMQNITSTQMVVLAGCETRRGPAPGPVLLNSDFSPPTLPDLLHSAAVPWVVASLWRVRNFSTYELMSQYYHHILDDSLFPPEALQRAKQKLSQLPAKFYASFVLSVSSVSALVEMEKPGRAKLFAASANEAIRNNTPR